jgi:hypothetical protein
MTVAEFHNTQKHLPDDGVSARWFTAAMILGTGFLAFAALAYVFG